MNNSSQSLVCGVIGGGAAGFFAAITCAENSPQHRVMIFEKTRQLLSKVRISGGGRCNVTHSCFDAARLVKNYPRGCRELRGPFTKFQPLDTIQWFEHRGVFLKTEDDGRMFPTTDSSDTIINCFLHEAKRLHVEIQLEAGVVEVKQSGERWMLLMSTGQSIEVDRLLIASGSHPKIHAILESLGHKIVPAVPSLFTFNVPQSPLIDLPGIAVNDVIVSLKGLNLSQRGPLLLTHWGFSGPAVLKLSAWAARELHQREYKAEGLIDWLPDYSEEEMKAIFNALKKEHSSKQVCTDPQFGLPKQLWKRFVDLTLTRAAIRWAHLANESILSLIKFLKAMPFQIDGKTTYKQEFVTAGGVSLSEVNFSTMESRIVPHLYFAGEVLDIDGVTGGFNFQNAWTTGWLAGRAMGMSPMASK